MKWTTRAYAIVWTTGLSILLGPAACGQAVFNLGTIVVDNDASSGDLPLTIPAGDYNFASLTTDWSPVAGDPWSSEALWAISDGPLDDPATTFFADPGRAPNSAENSDPVQLAWQVFLDRPLAGPLDGFLLTLQAFAGSVAEWADTRLELSFQEVVPPVLDLDLGVILNAFEPFSIDTFASDFDTELALYNAEGFVLASDDDTAGLQSQLRFPDGLAAGDYVAVLGGWDTLYQGGFQVLPGESGGNYGLNLAGIPIDGTLQPFQPLYAGFTIAVPEPAGSLGALLAALAVTGRRHRRPRRDKVRGAR